VNKKLLALFGLKWNPFSPDVPTDALLIAPRVESFCWRVENLAREGGFALVTGTPGIGKSVALRLLVERLSAMREIKIGVMVRPHSGVSDFYRELGDLFGVQLSPHNRWAGAKVLRERWQAHIDAALVRPVLVADEAQDMSTVVLNEMRTCRARGSTRTCYSRPSSPAIPASSRNSGPMTSCHCRAGCA
jgi:general secretion pathway protein A